MSRARGTLPTGDRLPPRRPRPGGHAQPWNLLSEQGEVSGARDAYQRAIDSGHAEHAPAAAVFLGYLLDEQGDVAGARDAYQRAIDSRHPRFGPLALQALETLEG